MRERGPKAVFTFSTTADAMAMESVAKEYGLPGRLIPVPSAIDAGCGFAWRCEPGEREQLLEGIAVHALAYEGLFEVEMY